MVAIGMSYKKKLEKINQKKKDNEKKKSKLTQKKKNIASTQTTHLDALFVIWWRWAHHGSLVRKLIKNQNLKKNKTAQKKNISRAQTTHFGP